MIQRVSQNNLPFQLATPTIVGGTVEGANPVNMVAPKFLVADVRGETWAMPIYKVHKGGAPERPTYQFLYGMPGKPGLSSIPLNKEFDIAPHAVDVQG